MSIINWDSVCCVYVLFVHECGTGKMGQIAGGGRCECCAGEVLCGWVALCRTIVCECECGGVYLPLLSVVYRLYLDIPMRYNKVTGWLLYLVCPVVALVSCRS